MATNDGNRTNLASSKIQTSRSLSYWFESNSNRDMAPCWFYKGLNMCHNNGYSI